MPVCARTVLRLVSALSVPLLALLGGCAGGNSSSSGGGGGGTTTTPGLVSGGAATVYTVQETSGASGSLLVFPATAAGSVTPSTTLTVPSQAISVATDSSGNIYLGSVNGTTGFGQVQVYAAGVTATSAPTRTLALSTNGAALYPIAMATDSAGQLYVLTTSNSILVYAAGASGATAPLRSFSSTALLSGEGVTVDTAGNIYVTNSTSATASTILVFASSATGAAIPSRSLTIPGFAYGVAVDSSLNVWVGVDTNTPSGNTTVASASIVEYAAGASGSATALKSIAGSGTTLANATIGGMRFDIAGNLWIVSQILTSSTTFNTYVEAWPASATGNQAPAVQFSSISWNSPSPQFAVR